MIVVIFLVVFGLLIPGYALNSSHAFLGNAPTVNCPWYLDVDIFPSSDGTDFVSLSGTEGMNFCVQGEERLCLRKNPSHTES